MLAIKTQKLTKYYGRHIGIKDLTLEVKEGEIFGFIGPNGAGKTTTIRLMLDLIRPTNGSATIFGSNINKQSLHIRKQIGYLPGEIFLSEDLTGEETIRYYSSFKEKVDHKYINELCKRLEFDIRKNVADYSKGNKQKLAIILALMHQPRLLILDEPTSGLDPLNQQEFYKLILEQKEKGTTIFFSTHILEEAEKLCDRVGIIRGGILLKIEDIDDFRDKNIREIRIETDSIIAIDELRSRGVKEAHKVSGGYHLIVSGPNGEIVKRLAKYNISDYKIVESSLEDAFFHYYQNK